ncbi:MAG: PQQ-binding-like beta-propeller repeat protein [Chloroflexi bacterium]|nr:PQQ-binding-like beta-propeller repeat protein [Chloroflexota bacterium]MBL7061376.1 PQQ-binding-like beta-propeller repeat protein [Dehalococcoidia bacterium]
MTGFFTIKIRKVLSLILSVIMLGLIAIGCGGPAHQGWSGFAGDDGILYFGSMDSRVLAIDPSARSQGLPFPSEGEWVLPIPTAGSPGAICGPACVPASPRAGIYATPVVIGDLVCVGTYAGDSGKLMAINRLAPGYAEGVPLRSKGEWAYPSGVQSIGAIVGSPVVVEDTLYVGTSEGEVYALGVVYGESNKWKQPFDTEGKIWTSPAIKDNVVYISNYAHKFFALSRIDGSLIWEIELPAAAASSPAVAGDDVFFGAFDNQLYAVDVTNGDVKWTFGGDNWFWSTPVVKDGVVYAGCLDNKIYALSASTGEELWQFTADGPIASTPVLVDNILVVASESGMVYMLKADSGKPEHDPVPVDASVKVPVKAPLYAEGNMVYVHASNRCVYCIDVQSGEKVWSFCYSEIE